MVTTESSILMSVLGFVGVLGTLVVFSYGYNRNSKYEAKLAAKARQSVAEIASDENSEVIS